jgi:hypothetical protein
MTAFGLENPSYNLRRADINDGIFSISHEGHGKYKIAFKKISEEKLQFDFLIRTDRIVFTMPLAFD